VEDRSRRRARLVLIAGLFLAAAAGVFTFFYASATKSEAPAPIPTTNVLVAAREIPQRTQITSADLRLVKINTDAAPPGALQKPEDAVGKITIISIAIGEPILPTKLAGAGQAPFTVIPADQLSPTGAIPPNTPNYRAMSITVGDSLAAGGNIQAGDTVDLLYSLAFDPSRLLTTQATQGANNPNNSDTSARIVLERVPILARALTTYVIRTDAATAERIAWLMSAGGQMHMLLRASKDDRATGTTGATFSSVQPNFKFEIPKRVAP
jgi:Flp pilus assembly protein CpaB